jgi:deoxyribodipyrimidine photolyase
MKKYFNPKEKKMEDLFETLCPVFSVSCRTPNVVNGYKGAAVYINVEAKDEEEAMNKAIANPEFTKHIHMKDFERKYLETYKPTGLYVIGRVEYFEGDERL